MNLLDFSVLGPLEARADGRVLELGSGRHVALLAFLLLHAGETVSRDAIFEALWRDPPATAPKMVHNYVSRLRKALGADRALELWRGEPLADCADEPFVEAEVARLDELRLAAIETRIKAELAL